MTNAGPFGPLRAERLTELPGRVHGPPRGGLAANCCPAFAVLADNQNIVTLGSFISRPGNSCLAAPRLSLFVSRHSPGEALATQVRAKGGGGGKNPAAGNSFYWSSALPGKSELRAPFSICPRTHSSPAGAGQRRRNSLGVIPTCCRKVRVRALWSQKPQAAAISASPRLVSRKSRAAACTRVLARNW